VAPAGAGTVDPVKPVRAILRAAMPSVVATLLTLAFAEIALRVIDFRILREGAGERSLTYAYDAELGWAPIPNSSSAVTTARTIKVQHNSLGLRDIEPGGDPRPPIMFIGDSFVWGVDAEAHERFTDLLRSRVASHAIVNAGVSGYGTDQQSLLLRRLWPAIKPAVVVLIFCANNDRADNSTNVRYDDYQKPYFATAPDGSLTLRGQPVPKSRQLYIRENWLVRHSWVARVLVSAYVEIRHPRVSVPDPTERLVSMIRDFVQSHGARFLVGLQNSDPVLIRHLQAEKIPFVAFDGAESYGAEHGGHWTPAGSRLVAERMLELLTRNGITAK